MRAPSETSPATSAVGENTPPDHAVNSELILDVLPHAVLVVGGEGHISRANAAAEIFFDAGLPLLRRTRFNDLVAINSPLLSLIAQVRRTHTSINEYNVDLITMRNRKQHLVDVYACPLAEPDHAILLILQQRNMAQMIERQLTHQASARSVSGLATVLAHEIKNPLSGIRGAAQLLEMNLDDEGRTWTRLICTETDRIRDLVNRMEIFGEERPPSREAVNIHSVLDHVKRLTVSGFGKNIAIQENYDPSLPPLAGDRDQLIQAMLNLAKNAAEAIGPDHNDGRIILSTAFKPGVRLSPPGTQNRVGLPLMLSIEDNGGGIPDGLGVSLFDPFVTTKRGGSGLGLALVAKIVRDHGGVIECDSRPGQTIFRIMLPLHNEACAPRSNGQAGGG